MHEIKRLVGSRPKISPSINFQLGFFLRKKINSKPSLTAAQCYLIDFGLPSGYQRSLLSGPERRNTEGCREGDEKEGSHAGS